MSENFFCVFESFGHFGVLAVQSSRQWILTSLSFEIDVSNKLLLTGQNDFGLVCEVYLDDFITEPEHNGVFCFHPLLDVDVAWREVSSISFSLVLVVKIVPEMLEQSDFLH